MNQAEYNLQVGIIFIKEPIMSKVIYTLQGADEKCKRRYAS